MCTCLGNSCSFGLRKLLSYVFSYFPFGFRAEYGIWLYQFLIIAYLFILFRFSAPANSIAAVSTVSKVKGKMS